MSDDTPQKGYRTAPVVRLASVDSTNAEAMRRAVAGERGPVWIMADAQSSGRGRAGRTWSSGAGNLMASLLVTLEAPMAEAYQLALVAGVAAFDAIAEAMPAMPPGLRLKWPNDILIGGAKAGGILIESTTIGHDAGEKRGFSAVVGIGINVSSSPGALDRPATHLAAHESVPAPEVLIGFVAEAAARWLAVWDEGRGFAAVREAWLTRAHPIGERMSVNAGSGRVSGAFLGLDTDGALLLHTDQGSRRFTFGDVCLEQ
jgi:BirA family biotin operon repressor/biotin-[acetyl-CoA-carboxylase] ligase